jgi:hypothetical protein
MLEVLLAALCALALLGCAGSDGGNGAAGSSSLGTCGVRADVSGAVTAKFDGNDDSACLTSHSFDSGLNGSFLQLETQYALQLDIADVAEGQTGDFPSTLGVADESNARWRSSACTTTLSEHELLEKEASTLGELRHYQVTGAGACDAPLEPVADATGTVELGPFEFRARFTWRD